MKLMRCRTLTHKAMLAAEQDGVIVDLRKTASRKKIHLPKTMLEIMEGGDEMMQKLREVLSGEVCPVKGKFTYLPPIETPGKILCMGLNYMDHIQECNEFKQQQFEPVIFNKFCDVCAAHDESIPLPPIAKQYDYEAELVIVIGKECINLRPEQANDYIFGYTVGNDISARDLQFRTGQWLIGKSLDKFAPLGPCIVPANELDPHNLNISCRLNGELRQNSNTSEMIFKPEDLVAYTTQLLRLYPGDIIFTGTPAGVIMGNPDPNKEWLKPGDVTEVTIEGIGTLRNSFCEPPPPPGPLIRVP